MFKQFQKHFLKALMMLVPVVALVTGMEAFQNWQQKQQAEQIQSNIGGDFTLQSADGDYQLSAHPDKLAVIYFGYTQCPDICPTSLSVLAHAFKQLSDDELKRFQGIFISVDPERDSVQHLKEYSKFFHDNIIGLTSTPEQILALSRQYGAFYQKVKLEGSAMGYSVDHTSVFYIVNSDGKVLATVPHSGDPAQILAALKQQL
ncbi:protein SCO1/2 [Oceanospirillum multiglobuliferum]|uniref:Thioredoxin domain-containing protein n=1 Tax=Oceanospirillum multiglobuliferum TaxID=64969 RepID=A0A1T4SDT8_9GAMM|nr:SCO family protein [Oceanospirillum multiglobuliferum]OPX54317.1 hypothetical protein BTE48_14735 [Oceanospirillum multiglobuliferum]SKA26382.1 protein SCO1/2 [Oceanospirillum multiglobuliferum]